MYRLVTAAAVAVTAIIIVVVVLYMRSLFSFIVVLMGFQRMNTPVYVFQSAGRF